MKKFQRSQVAAPASPSDAGSISGGGSSGASGSFGGGEAGPDSPLGRCAASQLPTADADQTLRCDGATGKWVADGNLLSDGKSVGIGKPNKNFNFGAKLLVYGEPIKGGGVAILGDGTDIGDGISGKSAVGVGIRGDSRSGIGVMGSSETGIGIQATNFIGPALEAQSSFGSNNGTVNIKSPLLKIEESKAIYITGNPLAGFGYGIYEEGGKGIKNYFSGLVGIGTPDPKGNLYIKNADSSVGFGISPVLNNYTDLTHNTYYDAVKGWVSYGGGPGALVRTFGGTAADSAITFYTSPNEKSVGAGQAISLPERMKIDKNGNVGIGTGTASPGEKLHVKGKIKLENENSTAANTIALFNDGSFWTRFSNNVLVDNQLRLANNGNTGETNSIYFKKIGDSFFTYLTNNVEVANQLLVSQVKITGGSPGENKVLTSNADGLASWKTPVAGGGASFWKEQPLGSGHIINTNLYSVGIGYLDTKYKLSVGGKAIIAGDLNVAENLNATGDLTARAGTLNGKLRVNSSGESIFWEPGGGYLYIQPQSDKIRVGGYYKAGQTEKTLPIELAGGLKLVSSNLPACNESTRGTMVFVRGEGGTNDRLYFCMRREGVFSWAGS